MSKNDEITLKIEGDILTILKQDKGWNDMRLAEYITNHGAKLRYMASTLAKNILMV